MSTLRYAIRSQDCFDSLTLCGRTQPSNRWWIRGFHFWEKARRVGKLTYPSVCWIWPSSKSSGFYAKNVLSDIEFQLCQEITTLIRSVPLVILQEKSRNWTSQLRGSLLTHWLHRDRLAHKRAFSEWEDSLSTLTTYPASSFLARLRIFLPGGTKSHWFQLIESVLVFAEKVRLSKTSRP